MATTPLKNDIADKKTNTTASSRVYEALRDEISIGTYGVGSRLTEGALAKSMNVSRTPVREALHRLASEGFVTLSPHAGALVKGWSAQDARDVFETRAIIESEAAARAARAATADDIAILEDLANRMEGAAGAPLRDVHGYSEMNRNFHGHILRMSGNRRIENIALNLMDLGFLVRSYRLFGQEDVNRSLSDHRQLVTAIRDGEADWAAAIMRAHVLSAACVFKGTHDVGDTQGETERTAPRKITQRGN
ncbi:MAG: hypothetical protein BM562_14170 [Alphaproteobacteria bacterium MedPE-SWcel]|nr:MAG: hypothetical protein BM562_14170 [Alphaproteobacteria bacterium MedPE-SWcel]